MPDLSFCLGIEQSGFDRDILFYGLRSIKWYLLHVVFNQLRCWNEDRTSCVYRPLARYVKLRVAHAPGIPGTFSPPTRFSDPDIHHDTCVTHVLWCMPRWLKSCFRCSRWRGKCFRHFRCMHNPQFYVSGKRPMWDWTKQHLYIWQRMYGVPKLICGFPNRPDSWVIIQILYHNHYRFWYWL